MFRFNNIGNLASTPARQTRDECFNDTFVCECNVFQKFGNDFELPPVNNRRCALMCWHVHSINMLLLQLLTARTTNDCGFATQFSHKLPNALCNAIFCSFPLSFWILPHNFQCFSIEQNMREVNLTNTKICQIKKEKNISFSIFLLHILLSVI